MIQRKKSLLALLMMLLLAVVVTACGTDTSTPDADPVDDTADEVDTDSGDDAADEEPADEPADEADDDEADEEPADEPAEAMPAILNVATTAGVTTWDPVASFSTEAFYMAQIYEQLLRVNPPGASERFTPLLAESWESNEDGTVWTFHLREGVTFHDGEAMNAEAVKLSLEAAADHGGASFIWWALDSIETPDDLTVVITMVVGSPVDLIASSLYAAWIVSPAVLDGDFEDGVAAGTGPYVLEDYTPDSEVVLTAYDGYWGDAPYYEIVVNTIQGEDTQQQLMLEGGEVDLATRLPVDSIDSFRENSDYTVSTEASFFNYVGYFNTLRAPLDDATVRQALSYAIPYEDIITIGAQGLGTQSRGPVPKGVWPWSEEVNQYTYDPVKAAELLAEAGYPGGEGFPTLRLTYAAENATEERFAPLIKAAFAEVGIEVEIEAVPFSQQWDEAKSDPENAQDIFLVLYWPTYSDAGSDNIWSLYHSSENPFFNLSYWANDEFDAVLDEAIELTISDPTRSQELYIEAMNMIYDQAPGISFFDTQAVFVVPNYIGGFNYNLNYPFVSFFFADLFEIE